MIFGCQQILINPDSSLKGILEYLCGESNKLHNCGVYLSRQLYFKTGQTPRKFDLHRALKSNRHFQGMYSHSPTLGCSSIPVPLGLGSINSIINYSGPIPASI